MATILCIETGTDTCSVGMARDGEIVSLRESSEVRDHAKRVAVYADEVLREAGAGALDAVAVSKGPGSYTGLRIGVSFAKGLCYGLGVPLIGIGSLDSLCAVAREEMAAGRIEAGDREPALFVPMIDARRMEVYGQVFDAAGCPLTEAGAWVIDEGSLDRFRERGEMMIFGSGAAKCREVIPWARFVEVGASARGLARMAEEAFAAGRFEDMAYFEPFYLKDFVVTTSAKKIF